MTAQFWFGLAALPATALLLLLVALAYVRTWDALERWAQKTRPRRIIPATMLDVGTNERFHPVSRRAPLLAAMAVARHLWYLKPLPGWVVFVVRDQDTGDGDTRLREEIRGALSGFRLPVLPERAEGAARDDR